MPTPRTRTDVVSCNLCGERVSREDRVWHKDGYDIVRCRSCGLVFRFDLPTADELARIYGDTYFKAARGDDGGRGYLDYLGDEQEHRRNAQRRLEMLRRYGADGRLIDVGAAAGFFVDEARRAGFDAIGIDVSRPMAEWARAELGTDVRTGRFLEVELPERVGIVTMWDYLEHVLDPRAELERAASLLRPGGTLALSTGDVESALARVSRSRWHLLTPEHHNFFFSKSTLARYLDRAGMDVVAMKFLSSRYSLRYVAHKTRTLGSGRLVRRLASAVVDTRVATVEVPLNLFDIVTVVARRR